MTTHTDNTATTWRDLSDQLTPEQIRQFETYEASALAAKHDTAAQYFRRETAEEILSGLLREARWEAEQNLTDATIGLPLPPHAEDAGHWDQDDTGTWTRSVHGQGSSITGYDAAVYLSGVQTRDGSVTWNLFVHVDDGQDMTADQVRDLGTKLIEAADELERLQ